MKYIDKFLKKLNTNRNTFATYVLTLLTAYFAIDRITEMLLMIFTGVSVSYWGPFMYTFALACPVFAFLFSGSSAFATSKSTKVTLFYTYVISLYIIAISMFTQWLNMGAWLLFISVPNYVGIITDFSDLVKPAFSALSLYLPLITIFPLFKWIKFGVDDSKDEVRSIWDYKGIDLSNKKEGHGPYTCEVFLCNDYESGKKIVISETSRYQSLFVCGGSGTGKTSLVFEPLMARDFERKYFFNEVSKEMGFTALKTGIATLNQPYNNDYINEHFNLNMLTPVSGKETIYKAYMKKMLLDTTPEYTYKNIGITSMSPDFETISNMINVCDNFNIKYNLIDPSNINSLGLNPFIYDDCSKIAVTISSVLKGMYNNAHSEIEEAYREDTVIQAIENLSILLKVMYPRMHEGTLPNIEDLLKLLTNFDLVEKMCEILKTDEELAKNYTIQLAYFKKHFYKDSRGRDETEKYVYSAVTQLDNLLRLPGVKNILCNRHNNIDFDKMLANGEVTFICTRRGDLGASTHKAFGLFFLLSMQNAVLRRPGNESTRVPHFLYIDEFPDFVCKATEAIFTMYRKYKVGTIISSQNLSQLETPTSKENYKQTILSNCGNKIFTGNATYEEITWWSNEFGTRRTWKYSNSLDTKTLEYDSKWTGIKWDWEQYFKPEKLQVLPTKSFAYKIKDSSGRPIVGEAKVDYLSSKYKEKHESKNYNFSKFTSGIVEDSKESNDENKKSKFDLKNLDFTDGNNEIDPIKTDTTDLNYLFDNEDAVTYTFKNKK